MDFTETPGRQSLLGSHQQRWWFKAINKTQSKSGFSFRARAARTSPKTLRVLLVLV